MELTLQQVQRSTVDLALLIMDGYKRPDVVESPSHYIAKLGIYVPKVGITPVWHCCLVGAALVAHLKDPAKALYFVASSNHVLNASSSLLRIDVDILYEVSRRHIYGQSRFEVLQWLIHQQSSEEAPVSDAVKKEVARGIKQEKRRSLSENLRDFIGA